MQLVRDRPYILAAVWISLEIFSARVRRLCCTLQLVEILFGDSGECASGKRLYKTNLQNTIPILHIIVCRLYKINLQYTNHNRYTILVGVLEVNSMEPTYC
ncbi:hypothetical protein KC19_12G061400 [Ceratodon purpureus]|uniref:Uncharacterized protein n=1 Tax=Ceratodon purpureus TaxID=3225 RepID=A0A8T0G875_CERPU|nr:hypothetical protein KC19_12G061400 [Ceratodon purpureus]